MLDALTKEKRIQDDYRYLILKVDDNFQEPVEVLIKKNRLNQGERLGGQGQIIQVQEEKRGAEQWYHAEFYPLFKAETRQAEGRSKSVNYMTETEKIILEATNKAERLETKRTKKTFLLVLIIILAVAFIESGSWRDFAMKVLIYGLIAEFVVLLFNSIFSKE